MPRLAAAVRQTDEPVLNERTRHLANIPGRYYLDKWRQQDERRISAFACRIQRISPLTMSLKAPVGGEVGDRVTTHFDEFGLLRGKITRALGFGFVMSLDLSETQRESLARRVRWFERRKNYEVNEMRRFRRVAPQNPQSTLVLADGTTLDCFVINMSASGVAISADFAPELGTPLAVGSAVGRVVRFLNPGFAVQFIEPITSDCLETRLIRPKSELSSRDC